MIASKPLVSIIMNCFDGEKYLQEAIDSIYAQTYKNWEIIFWDNASTDNSSNIAKSYDSRLKYFYRNKNTSLGEARFLATGMANGEYLAFLDCDDLWLPGKLKKQVECFFNKPDLGIVYGDAVIIFDKNKGNNEKISKGKILPEGNVFPLLVKHNFIPFVSAMVSRDKYYECGGFSTDFKNSTDYDLFLKLAYKYEVVALQYVCCKYREHENNLSKKQYVIGVAESIRSLRSFPENKIINDGIRFHNIDLALAFLKEGEILNSVIITVRNGIIIKVSFRVISYFVRSLFAKF